MDVGCYHFVYRRLTWVKFFSALPRFSFAREPEKVGHRIECSCTKFKGPSLSYSFYTNFLGAIQSMPLETTLILLEKSTIQPIAYMFYDLCVYIDWIAALAERNKDDLFNILGALYILVQCVGINNSTTALPFIVKERTILYREKLAGMYSSWAYSLSQVTIEMPYIFFITSLLVIITYTTIGFYWSAYKVFCYFYTMFCTLLYFNFLGTMLVALTPSDEMARVLAIFSYTVLNLFSGYLIPRPGIPKWWIWAYWICPTSWTLKGFVASQYGDINTSILVFDEQKSLGIFLKDYFGYEHDDLHVVSLVLLGFPILFASLSAFGIAKLNFQKS